MPLVVLANGLWLTNEHRQSLLFFTKAATDVSNLNLGTQLVVAPSDKSTNANTLMIHNTVGR